MTPAEHPSDLDPFGTGRLPSGRHGLSPEMVARSQRERMVEAMITVAANKGYAATTVADVIAAAGVSRATFYEQFGDKEDCFVAAYETVMGRMLDHVIEGFRRQPSGPWVERVRAGVSSLLSYLAINPVAARVGIVEGFGAGARARDSYQEAVSSFFPFLEEGREESGRPDRVPAHTARLVVGGVSALMFAEAAAGRAAELPQRTPEMLYLIVAPYLGREPAREAMEEARRLLPEAGNSGRNGG